MTNERQVLTALATETGERQVGGERQAANTALPDTLWRAALVFLPLAFITAIGFYFIYHLPTAVEAAQGGLPSNLRLALAAALVLLAMVALLICHQGARLRQTEVEVRQLNDARASDNEKLEMLNRELETFSYSVSRDLRGPLRAIDGFSKALLDDYSGSLDQAGHDHLARVRNAAQRMGDLIDDLLKLSQVGRTDLNLLDDVDLSETASSIAESLQRLDPARDINFVAEPRIRARCDPRMMRIVLENLFGNAWKFTVGRKPAVIEFGKMQVDGRNAYFVRDNGVGFDMGHAGKLFGAFQRLHSNSAFAGTGIGLATVERIVKEHGGYTWAEARPNEGAALAFTLGVSEPK